MTRTAAVHSAALSVLFLVVYTACNWITAQRANVGTWYFEWERQIPFASSLIVPYLSIDLFFVIAPFLCHDREELRVYTRRTIAAIVIAGTCFLLFPLRFGFDRPPVEGWNAPLMEGFVSLDRPFNLFPSLHVTLGVILAEIFRRHSRGAVRNTLTIWFVLVVVSTVFVYQHHIVDVIGGLGLSAVVLYTVRARSTPRSLTPSLRIAGYYAVGALFLAVLGIFTWPWGAALLWPAIGLGIVASAYVRVGPAVFCKTDGQVALSAKVLLGPCLLGHWLSHLHYRRYCRRWDELEHGVWIGGRLNARESAAAIKQGVTAVLDLAPEFEEAVMFRRLEYRSLPILDLTAPTMDQLDEAVRFIRAGSRRGIVYVHCKIGYSRTGAVAAAYLLSTGRARTTDEALATLRRVRPSIVVRPEAELAVRQFETRLSTRRVPRLGGPPLPTSVFSALAGLTARLMCGRPRWEGCAPTVRPRIYFANHTSHLDFPLLWGSLPPDVRVRTRPVAGRDYWDRGVIRRCLARRVFRMLLVNRCESGSNRDTLAAAAARSVRRAARALNAGSTLIIFPEGTRGSGESVQPFKSGLYHLCKLRPDVELVPAFLENVHRILPKGEAIPLPLAGSVTFGRPIRLQPGEEKSAFLARARRALVMAGQPCNCLPTPISRAS